jgi:hypothetical protein
VQKIFNLQLCKPTHDFDHEDTEEGRFYNTPFGRFPSVTTKLSKYFDVDLSDWKNRVGEKQANKITKQGAQRGTAMHQICENYILGNEYKLGVMPMFLEAFLKVKPVLDENVTTVYGIEFPLHSVLLQTAGRTDLICDFQGEPTIVDFKTARRFKKEEWIESYIIQTTTYAFMSNAELEHLNCGIKHICIIIAVDGEPKPQIIHKLITDQMLNRMHEVMRH